MVPEAGRPWMVPQTMSKNKNDLAVKDAVTFGVFVESVEEVKQPSREVDHFENDEYEKVGDRRKRHIKVETCEER